MKTKGDVVNLVLLRHPEKEEVPKTITLNQAILMMEMWEKEIKNKGLRRITPA
jgi:hypothetical protein